MVLTRAAAATATGSATVAGTPATPAPPPTAPAAQPPAPPQQLPAARPYADLPISIGRLRVLRGFQLISWVIALVWLYFVIHPALGLSVQRKIDYDENAVSPTNPVPVLMQPEQLGLYLEGAVSPTALAKEGAAADWFKQQLEDLELVPYEHGFVCSGGSGKRGRNVYAVLRPPHTLGNEALVLAVPLPAAGRRLLSAATALAVARVASSNTWMSKSIVLLGFDATSCTAGESDLGTGAEAVEAWLEAYHRAGGLPKHAGLLREALVLDLDGKVGSNDDGSEPGFTGDLDWLAVLHEGWGGVMPNLDLMATIVLQAHEVMPAKVLHVGASPFAGSLPELLAATSDGDAVAGCSTDMLPPGRFTTTLPLVQIQCRRLSHAIPSARVTAANRLAHCRPL